MNPSYYRKVCILVSWLAWTVFSAAALAELNCNVGIEFYPNDGIKRCNLNGNDRIYTAQGQGLTCVDGHMLVQYPDGKLKVCTIAIPLAFDSKHCDALSQIKLGPKGNIKKCE